MFARLRPGRTSVSDIQNDLNILGAASEAPTDTFPIGENDNTYSIFVCQYCQKVYKTDRGLALHQRSKHDEIYHASNVRKARKKARWDDEELVLLAREEIRLTGLKVKNISAELTPSHQAESVRGGAPPDGVFDPGRSWRADDQSLHLDHDSWIAKVRNEIADFKFAGLDVDLIKPDCLSEEDKEFINLDFDHWVESMTAHNCAEVVPPGPKRRGGVGTRVAKAPGNVSHGVTREGESTTATSVGIVPPNARSNKRKKRKRPNSSWGRRAAYKRTQDLFRKNKSRCAQDILSGSWERPRRGLPLEDQEPYWREIFEQESVQDLRTPEPFGPALWDMIDPISLAELEATMKAMKPGAPGPDRMVLSQLKHLNGEELRARFNLWVLAGYSPTSCCMDETILLPKDQNDIRPPKHRPITMANLIVRCYHKLMARRMGDLMPISDRQKAFRVGDGLGENVFLLRAIIKHHTKECLPLNVVFLDISKAFDLVSHQSILIAAKRMGVPPPLLSYLHKFYLRSQTRLRVGGKKSEPISVKRGVKQGDPMSVHLFNAVIDWALSTLDPDLGIKFNGVNLNHLAFADDIGLLTKTSVGAQSQIDHLNDHLNKCGLFISAGSTGKSASLKIDVDGKRKLWVVNPNVHLHVAGEDIPAKSIGETYEYLGVPLSAKGAIPQSANKQQKYLDNLSRAPLKPQQRLYILKQHVIPALYHPAGLLTFLDAKIRGAVKRWLKLPENKNDFFIHAPVIEGGLGVAVLKNAILLMWKSRLEKLLGSSDPAVAAVAGTSFVADMLRSNSVPLQVAGIPICNKENLKRALAYGLHRSVDGSGLNKCSQISIANKWVDSPTHLIMSGTNYIGAIKVRGNLMATAARMARGRPQRDVACDACGRTESLGHINQVCPRTSGARIDRHNSVLARTVKVLVKNHWSVLVEPAIPTPAGIRRPDIVAWKGGSTCYVIDVTVVADNADLDRAHQLKIEHYDTQHVRDWALRVSGTASITFSSVSFNWRGALAGPSYHLLKNSLALSEYDIALLPTIVMEKGYQTWLDFKRSMFRARGRNG
ncbi:reverse transcriptase [Paramuricea clavata]|uniref:Reverse transcriptase n=1 Tax=Paramuricea clavata TaxID=317549 RepID=A0A6S7ISB4_PARCT|nr:reverse transcriptase [Paramuricea clavata]